VDAGGGENWKRIFGILTRTRARPLLPEEVPLFTGEDKIITAFQEGKSSVVFIHNVQESSEMILKKNGL
jgi:hypothetical protein